MFDNVTSLDIHQAEFHGKTQLRIRTKEDHEIGREENKKEVITQAQYERMNKKKQEHFPSLLSNPAAQDDSKDEEDKVEADGRKSKNKPENVPFRHASNRKALEQNQNFPGLPLGENPVAGISKEPIKERKKQEVIQVKESKRLKAAKKRIVVETEARNRGENLEDIERRQKEEAELNKLIKESVKEAIYTEPPRQAQTSHGQRPKQYSEPL